MTWFDELNALAERGYNVELPASCKRAGANIVKIGRKPIAS